MLEQYWYFVVEVFVLVVDVVNLDEKFGLIKDLHSYKVVAQMNDYYFKLVKAKREFVWHMMFFNHYT